MARAFLMRAIWAVWLAIGAVLLAGADAAQATPDKAQSDAHLAEMLDAERALIHVTPADHTPDCPAQDDFQAENAIVVCRHHTDTSRYRVPSSADQDPRSNDARRTGVPRAPYVGSMPDCTAAQAHCHFIGHAPPPVYYLDTTTLPEPAEGTDAWKIAHGLMAEH